MRLLWVTKDIDAEAATLWDLLTDLERWSDWGPSVRGATVDGDKLEAGATGTVQTAVGVDLPYAVTEFEDGRSWAWTVLGVPATSHSVQPLSGNRCRVGFGVPWPMAPYLGVCAVALRRLDQLATAS